MNHSTYLSVLFLFLSLSVATAQTKSSKQALQAQPLPTLTIEPAIGLNPATMGNLLVSNIVQWNIKKGLSIVSYTSYGYNNALQRDFNYIHNDYNNSFSQKFGIGTSVYGKHATHSFSMLAGIKYDAFKETLNNPEFEPVSVAFKSTNPDFGLMYNLKLGKKKFFFSYRMYIPLYPYPFLRSDVTALDGNLANVTMEFGLGIRLK